MRKLVLAGILGISVYLLYRWLVADVGDIQLFDGGGLDRLR